ncbi:MAG TPA: LysR family transcriptional regulator [Methylomirabilota bacterium]|nr:LysR family transcriptional regulator [Methylomirabilota bacterium]
MIATHKLEHAAALAEHRNFRQAAEALHLSQPALSRSIQSLESALGARLFDRGHGTVEPTALGRLFLEHARSILSAVAELEHEIELAKGLRTGTLEVSLAPYPSALSGQRAVARLLAGHPELQFRVRVAGFHAVAEDVAAGRCDLGVADLEAAAARGLETEILVRRPLHFVARPGHPLLARTRCGLDDMLGYPWAAIRAPSRIALVLPADMRRAGRWDPDTGEFTPALEVDVVSDFLVLARESEILVAATLTMAERELEEGHLAVVPFTPPWLELAYGFISRPNRTLSPATLAFMDIVREIEAELDERERALRERFLPPSFRHHDAPRADS